MKAVIFLIVMLLWVPLMVVFDAYVLLCLWEWFMVPQFDLAPLTLGMAAGISLLGTFFYAGQTINVHGEVMKNKRYTDEEKTYHSTLSVIYALMKPVMILVTGKVIHVLIS